MALNSLHQNLIYWLFPTAALEQSLRAIWDAASWAAVLILPPIKLHSQLSSCTFFFSLTMAISNPKTWCCQSVALNMSANLENSAVATGLEKVSFHSNPKECSNNCTIALISHASKVMLKIIQARFQQYMMYRVQQLSDVQAGFRKGRATRYQIANICWIIEKAREFQKTLLLPYWLHQSIWPCVSQQTVGNSYRNGNTRPHYLPPEKSACRSRNNR